MKLGRGIGTHNNQLNPSSSIIVSEGGTFPSPSLVVPPVPLLFLTPSTSLSTGLSGLLLNPLPFTPGAGVTILGVDPPPDTPLRFLSKKYASSEAGETLREGVETARCGPNVGA